MPADPLSLKGIRSGRRVRGARAAIASASVPADSRRVAAFVGLFGANEMTILVAVLLLSLIAVAVSWLQPRGKVPESKPRGRFGEFQMPSQGLLRTGAPRGRWSPALGVLKPHRAI
jgi:hypothetical protein